jgi:RNA polymerase sigma factor (sigma-70 family)
MPRVFISHSNEDCSFVEAELLPLLAKHGIDTWYSQVNIQTADQWEQKIREGLEESDWFLVVMSSRSAVSQWVAREVHWAMEERPHRVIPIMMEPCDIHDWHIGLRVLQYVDFHNNKRAARHKLLAVWSVKGVTGSAPADNQNVTHSDERPSESSAEPVHHPPNPAERGGVVVQTGTAPIELVINRDFNSYSSQEQGRLLSAIKELLGVSEDIRVIRKRPGTVRLTLALTPEQAEKLLWAVKGGDLTAFGVVDAALLIDEFPRADDEAPSLAALREGDPVPAQQLWERYWPRLVGLARARLRGTRRTADAEDVALEAFTEFIHVLERRGSQGISDENHFWSLLVAITARKVVAFSRRAAGSRRLPHGLPALGTADTLDRDPSPESAAMLAAECRRLLDSLADPVLRSIAVHRLEGATTREIATRLGCSEATVGRKLTLIRKTLERASEE